MMRQLCLVCVIILIFASASFSQELFIRNDKYSTELYLKLNLDDIRSIEKRASSAVIYFRKQIRSPFTRSFQDEFIKSIEARNDTMTVNIEPGSDFTVMNDVSGIKIVATKQKTSSDILSSYGIGKPLLTNGSSVAEDAAQENALLEADKFITAKQFGEAANVLNNILNTTKNNFYRQEALYKLGQTYFLMAAYDGDYLLKAYGVFDDFAKLYPDNFRVADALQKSAEAKEGANQLYEAVFTYQKIFDSVPDLESKRIALISMARIYKTIGQLDKAINIYLTYLKNFRADQDKINAEIGQIYFDLKEMNLAYEYFSLLDIDKIINDKSITPLRLFAIAKTMETKKRFEEALKLYAAIYEKFPDSDQTNDAIYNSAEILQKTGREAESDRLYLRLKELFPDKVSGQKATIEYAKKYLNSKPSTYWKDFFKDLLSRPDTFGMQQEADYLIIKSLYAENKINEVMPLIEDHLKQFVGSPYYVELNKIREQFMYANAEKTFKAGDYNKSEGLLNTFIAEYPESASKAAVSSMLTDIRYFKAKNIFAENKFKDATRAAESYLVENPKANDTNRWLDLYDDAEYRDVGIAYASDDFASARVKAREYLSKFTNGKYRKQVSEFLENSLRRPMESYNKANAYQDVIKLYEANQDWLASWPNKNFKDEMTALAALAVYKSGSAAKARILYSEIKPNDSINYIILGLLVGDKNVRQYVNKLPSADLRYVVSEVGLTDPDGALAVLKAYYTQDPKLTSDLEYNLIKTIPSDAKRQELLADLYGLLRSNTAARFNGSDAVFLDAGLMYYRKNDFKTAAIALKEFADMHADKDEKRAEALYYLGKSFVSMNDKTRGYQFYNEIISTMPDSIYAGIARSELDEDSWKQGLNNR